MNEAGDDFSSQGKMGSEMSKAALSVMVFGVYVLFLGAALMGFPNQVLDWFGLAQTREVWIRVAGMLVALLGGYYLAAAKTELIPFMRWTVYGRASVVIFFLFFVLVGWGPPILLAFGLVDLAGAAWTWRALKD